MKFIFKVLVLVSLIVMSKVIKEDESKMVAAKPPVSVQQSHAAGFESDSDELRTLFPKAAEAKVEKASLQFN
jgi:hypothetical protein